MSKRRVDFYLTACQELDGLSRPVIILRWPHGFQYTSQASFFLTTWHYQQSGRLSKDDPSWTRQVVINCHHFQAASPPPAFHIQDFLLVSYHLTFPKVGSTFQVTARHKPDWSPRPSTRDSSNTKQKYSTVRKNKISSKCWDEVFLTLHEQSKVWCKLGCFYNRKRRECL